MNWEAKLAPQESRVAERIVYGRAKKQIAGELNISTHTVANTARNIYTKIGAQCIAQLCVWWFCTKHHIKPAMLSIFFVSLLMIHELKNGFNPARRVHRVKETRRSMDDEDMDEDCIKITL